MKIPKQSKSKFLEKKIRKIGQNYMDFVTSDNSNHDKDGREQMIIVFEETIKAIYSKDIFKNFINRIKPI